MSDLSTLTWRVADGVGWVTLDRPYRYNAFDKVMCDELQALWLQLRTDDSVRCIVLGAEGRGLRPLVRRACDGIVSIPLAGYVDSLNVSVAAGIFLFEARRQRAAQPQ